MVGLGFTPAGWPIDHRAGTTTGIMTIQAQPQRDARSLIAVDIGNARIKCGLFGLPRASDESVLPRPAETLGLDGRSPDFDRLGAWLTGQQRESGPRHWYIASVNRPSTTALLDWLRDHRPDDAVRLLASDDLPLTVTGPQADMVGIDRLLDALAANTLRTPGRAAVVVDVGTAITVELVDADGAFRGGAILPGIVMSARAMHEFTDLLPLIDMNELGASPPPVGTSTEDAMRAGLFWMAVGAIRELCVRMIDEESTQPEVFVSGGAGVAVADLLGPDARHVPHLTLGGIALAAAGM
jgi:type III pantothenate kinase